MYNVNKYAVNFFTHALVAEVSRGTFAVLGSLMCSATVMLNLLQPSGNFTYDQV
jgi:hypothetical protein